MLKGGKMWKNDIWLLPPSIPSTFVTFINTYASYTYQWLWLNVLTKKSNTNKGKNKSCWADPGDLNISIGKSMSICPCMFWCVSIMLKHYLSHTWHTLQHQIDSKYNFYTEILNETKCKSSYDSEYFNRWWQQ